MALVGGGSSTQLCRTISQFGVTRLLVVTDKPLLELGVLEGTLAALNARGIDYHIYDGVLPDPTKGIVDAGIEQLKEHRCEAVLAFGGGSLSPLRDTIKPSRNAFSS